MEEEGERYHTLNDKDEYLSQEIFFVPEKTRWNFLQSKTKLSGIGMLLDDAMDEIKRPNPSLKGVLPKIFADPDLEQTTPQRTHRLSGRKQTGWQRMGALAALHAQGRRGDGLLNRVAD